MTEWRLLNFMYCDAFTNMAIDEAILTACHEGRVPNTLRFYRWDPSTVSIGRFQKISQHVHLDNCQRDNIDVVRRITGGGTVYHDADGEITYSVIVQEQDVGAKDIIATYNVISHGLIQAVRLLGVTANFDPGDPRNCPNLAINGKKISGSAQRHKGGVLLQHGTLLLDVDLAKMFTYLKVPWAQTLADVMPIARKRITSLKHERDSPITIEQGYQALVQGFQIAFNTKFHEEQALTPSEQKLAHKLRVEKYLRGEWTHQGSAK